MDVKLRSEEFGLWKLYLHTHVRRILSVTIIHKLFYTTVFFMDTVEFAKLKEDNIYLHLQGQSRKKNKLNY